MKKNKGKMELRYYDVPQNEYLIALYGDPWKRNYGGEKGLLHIHNLFEIGICRSGSGILQLEDDEIPFHGGMISLIPPNYPHTTTSNPGTESYWEYLFVDFERLLAACYSEDILFQQKMLERIQRRAYFGEETEFYSLQSLAHMIMDEMQAKKELYRESVKGLAQAMLMSIVRLNVENLSIADGMKQKTGFDQVRPSLDYIRENYATQMKISDIAMVCHMSESHFRRVFKECIDLTPVEYLNQVRVRKACDLIKKTGYSMEEVAVKVGFTTTSTFNRNFKRITGSSPYQWKKQPENYESKLTNFNILVEKGW